MKNKLYGLLACLIILTAIGMPLAAQIGVKGAFNLTQNAYDPNGYTENRFRSGFSAGLFAILPLIDNLKLQVEFGYIQKGGKIIMPTFLPPSDFNQKLDYLVLPLLLKWSPMMDGSVSPCILIGPYGALLLGAYEANGTHTSDIKDRYRSFDYGLCLGVGLDFDLRGHILTLDLRYDLGLMNIASQMDCSAQSSIKNRTFFVSGGFMF